MEYFFLLAAFLFGFGCKFLNLPPLIGYLLAGFALNIAGYQNSDVLQTIANLGITIMLFTIGLKLNLSDLAKREIWLGSIAHGVIWIVLSSLLLFLFGLIGISLFIGLSIEVMVLIGFAYSFSSTVCVVKLLEESGESKTRHGKIAIGILIMQDIFAVLFLVAVTGSLPSLWAILLFALIPATPFLHKLLNASGHGELLPLSGFIFALGGYQLFELVGIKGDLGALIFGVLLAKHAKANELAKSLLGFKDILLIGFFLTIGLAALPNLSMILAAAILTLLIPIKFLLFFKLFTVLGLRARTSYLTGLIMSNYSEFGLIVGAVSVSLGVLSAEWLVVLALSVSMSFIITSVLYKNSHKRYQNLKGIFKNHERKIPLNEDQYPSLSGTTILVIGMGRVGTGAFTALDKALPNKVWGMDADKAKVEKVRTQGLSAIVGDGENSDLWENLNISDVELVMLALPSIQDSANITDQLRVAGYTGKIAAIARYEDQVAPLLDKGVDKVFNFFTEAGLGFAEESFQLLDISNDKLLER